MPAAGPTGPAVMGAVPAAGELMRAETPIANGDVVSALEQVLFHGASDLHVTANSMPMLRIDGRLRPVTGAGIWSAEEVVGAVRGLMSEEQKETFDKAHELDFAYALPGGTRFRVNCYQQRGATGAAFRIISTSIRSLEELGVPDVVAQFATLPRGLVLVTGPTGSGKSTTLAALIDLVNRTRYDHIVTVEDPIEYVHSNKRSLVNQREVGNDTHSFTAALKHVLRQDPDVILIGEMRDLETISVALTAAETGHLVFATLHTQDASQTIDRIIDVYPSHQQDQIRTQLAATLQGVVSQTLVPRASGTGRVIATEVLLTTPAIANLIREGKAHQITSSMQAGRALGMHTMDQHLADLVNEGEITRDAAFEKAHDPDSLDRLIRREDMGPSDLTFNAERILDARTTEEALTCRSPSRTTRTRVATTPARSSRASSRRPARPPRCSKIRGLGLSPVTVAEARAGTGLQTRDQDPRLREGRRPQVARDHEPPDGDHDQLRPVAAARAVDPVGADREQEARRHPAAGHGRRRERRIALATRSPSTRSTSRRS